MKGTDKKRANNARASPSSDTNVIRKQGISPKLRKAKLEGGLDNNTQFRPLRSITSKTQQHCLHPGDEVEVPSYVISSITTS